LPISEYTAQSELPKKNLRMPVNRNALIRYRTIDSCLRNRHRQWTLEDLIDACSHALFEYEGIDKGVSRRTIQTDLETMRSGKLGYEAPIVVIERKYYTYDDKDFTITNIPLDAQDLHVLAEASLLLRQFKGLPHSDDLNVMLTKLEDRIHSQRSHSGPVIEFERNDLLAGLHWIEPLRQHIVDRRCAQITYRSFRARSASRFLFSPYLLKEYRNRWFVYGMVHDRSKPFRPLALDRIHDVDTPEEADVLFIPNTVVDLAAFFADMIGVTRSLDQQPRQIIFRASPASAPYLLTKPLHASQQVLASERGHVTFSVHVVINYELIREFLGFGADVEVLEPSVLRQHVMTTLATALEQYQR
jgi:predicted DNA-binding transcriptional regulator YafY